VAPPPHPMDGSPRGTTLLKFALQVSSSASLSSKNDLVLPAGVKQEVRGSSWGTFTIACTIPIALFVGLYMYRIRKGRVVEASLIGAAATLAATFYGSYIPDSPLREYFSLTHDQTTWALMTYGFIASVLP